jgi:hypothetical protein
MASLNEEKRYFTRNTAMICTWLCFCPAKALRQGLF